MKMQRSDTYSQIINTADVMFARSVKEDMAQEYVRNVREKAGKEKGNDITVGFGGKKAPPVPDYPER